MAYPHGFQPEKGLPIQRNFELVYGFSLACELVVFPMYMSELFCISRCVLALLLLIVVDDKYVNLAVVYFDQRMGAPHTICWLK